MFISMIIYIYKVNKNLNYKGVKNMSLLDIFKNRATVKFLYELMTNGAIKEIKKVCYFGCYGIEFKVNNETVGLFLDGGEYRVDIVSNKKRTWCKNLFELKNAMNSLINEY